MRQRSRTAALLRIKLGPLSSSPQLSTLPVFKLSLVTESFLLTKGNFPLQETFGLSSGDICGCPNCGEDATDT